MRILVIAPHNDDEVLGVGGTIAKYAKIGYEVYVCEVTSGDDFNRSKHIRSEAFNAHRILGVKETMFLGLPAVKLRETPVVVINTKVFEVVERIKPTIVFIPHKGDLHVDHIEVSNSVLVALRPTNNPQVRAIYSYETLSETEWNTPTADNAFIPNVWSDISETIELKKEAMACYKSQLREFPNPRSLEAIEALSKFRGSTICVNNAESFMLIRNVI